MTTERQLSSSMPENFRGNEFGYFPTRIIEETERVGAFRKVRDCILAEKPSDMAKIKYRQKLFDLIFHNGFGRVFPIPNSTGDFIGVVKPQSSSAGINLDNCIVAIIADGKLSLAGGFNHPEEALTQTVARNATHKLGVSNITDYTFFGEQSNPNRDNREITVTSCCAGAVQAEEAIRKNGVYLLPLYDEYYQPVDYSKAGEYVDATGKKFTHTGYRLDHELIVRKFYNFWKKHSEVVENGTIRRLPLAEMLKRVSAATPHEWFKDFKDYPEAEGNVDVNGKALRLTPNIKFLLEKAEAIFSEYQLRDPHEKALEFISELVDADVVPEHPQASVTVDCLLVKSDETGDKLIVHQLPDGRLSLPGSFYSPDPREVMDKSQDLETFAKEVMARKYAVDFKPCYYAGTVGGKVATGDYADKRYPRISHIEAGIITNAYSPKPGKGVPEGSQVIEIPIWENKEKCILSKEITEGINNQRWAYSHNSEILVPLLPNLLKTYDPSGKLTAREIMMRLYAK